MYVLVFCLLLGHQGMNRIATLRLSVIKNYFMEIKQGQQMDKETLCSDEADASKGYST